MTGEGTFEDARVGTKKVTFTHGRTSVSHAGLTVDLSDRAIDCTTPKGKDAFSIFIDVPEPPADPSEPLSFGTHVGSLDLDTQNAADPGEAKLTLRAYSRKAGGRIKGSIAFARDRGDRKYNGGADFDVAVCPDNHLDRVLAFPRTFDKTELRGTAGGKPFIPKTVLAYDSFGSLQLAVFEGEATCDTRSESESRSRFFLVRRLGVSRSFNASGSLHPAEVTELGTKGGSVGYTLSPGAWIKLEKTELPPKTAVKGALVIASRANDPPDQSIEVAGTFTATFCPE